MLSQDSYNPSYFLIVQTETFYYKSFVSQYYLRFQVWCFEIQKARANLSQSEALSHSQTASTWPTSRRSTAFCLSLGIQSQRLVTLTMLKEFLVSSYNFSLQQKWCCGLHLG